MEEGAKALDRVIFVGGLPDTRPNDGIHGPPDIRLDLLAEQSHPDARFADDRSAIRRKRSGKNVEEGGLSGAVATQQANAFTPFDVQRYVVEQHMATIGHREILCADQGHGDTQDSNGLQGGTIEAEDTRPADA